MKYSCERSGKEGRIRNRYTPGGRVYQIKLCDRCNKEIKERKGGSKTQKFQSILTNMRLPDGIGSVVDFS